VVKGRQACGSDTLEGYLGRRPGCFLGKSVWGDIAAAVLIWRLSY